MRSSVYSYVIAIWFITCMGTDAAAQESRPIEIVPQLGHSSYVTALAISPDGKSALSGGGDGTLSLWDLLSGREVRKIRVVKAFFYSVNAVAFSPDGKSALSGSTDGTLRLWDLFSGRQIREICAFDAFVSSVNTVAFSPDGKTALSGGADGTLRLWDLAEGQRIREFKGLPFGVSSVASRFPAAMT